MSALEEVGRVRLLEPCGSQAGLQGQEVFLFSCKRFCSRILLAARGNKLGVIYSFCSAERGCSCLSPS